MQKAFSSIKLKWRNVRNYSQKKPTSNIIRQQFLDFFIKENNHTFVKSSSVIPFCDPSLSFTNAGMNQFKNILIGKQIAKYKRVANSQKCIRVGGKHNDLSIVGQDSYHHTFFEMLGNWSFGDYFKRDACRMAWTLLTEVYKIPKERLYVTYFKGDKEAGLKADSECREIWLELGVPKDRIIGFGSKENFWEMASSGPCGRCTEIHLDHLPSYKLINRSKDVNQDKSDLTEIWNLVFIENFRRIDGSVENLSEKHVDTGMGFERLVAFLQGKSSNYDTDLFMPIIEKIRTATNLPYYTGTFVSGENLKRDTSYRVLADHSRMVAISLADGMFPEQNQKLRRILRKCLVISEKHFHHNNLLNVTIPAVANVLGDTFPELHQKLFTSLDIVKYEEELFKMLRDTMSHGVKLILENNPKLEELNIYDYPGFIAAYNELKKYKKSHKIVSGEMAFYIHTSFGLDFPLIERLAELENMTVDSYGFYERMNAMKKSNQKDIDEEAIKVFDNSINATENDGKYDYQYDRDHQIYKTKVVKSEILSIVDGGKIIQVITSKSPFYYESGGQISDEGFFLKNNTKYQVESLKMHKNFIIHNIFQNNENPLKIGDEVTMHVNDKKKTACIRNHTATHLLNAMIRETINLPIYQKSSGVTANHLKIELAILGPKLNEKIMEDVEKNIRKLIKESPLERKVRVINSQELEGERDVLMVPGEIYPDSGIRVVNFGDFSKELCCGTHAFNTSELIEFTFLNIKSTGRTSYIFTATTGQGAVEAIRKGDEMLNKLHELNETLTIENFAQIMTEVRKISAKLSTENISYFKRLECNRLINGIKENIKQKSRSILTQLLDVEMKSVSKENEENPFIIHYLACADLMKSVSIQKATKFITDKPVMILSLTDDEIKARCVVPKELISENFDAKKWLSIVGECFKSKVEQPKGQNPLEVCFMKGRKIRKESFSNDLENAINEAEKFAMQAMNKI